MDTKFEFKDIMNNIIAGLLWEAAIVMIVYLINPEIIKQIDLAIVKDFIAVIFTLALIFAFVLGIILRGLEYPFLKTYRYLFGDPYYLVFKPEKDAIKEKIGIFYSISKFEKQLGRFDSEIGAVIKTKLKSIGIIHQNPPTISSEERILSSGNQKNKKELALRDIGILAERYLMVNNIVGPFTRFKDLKNFFESVSFPLFLSLIMAKWVLFPSVCFCWYFIALLVLFLLFVRRYDYYMRNYVKDIFRFIFFVEIVKNDKTE